MRWVSARWPSVLKSCQPFFHSNTIFGKKLWVFQKFFSLKVKSSKSWTWRWASINDARSVLESTIFLGIHPTLETIRPYHMVHNINDCQLNQACDSIQIWSLSWFTCKLMKSILEQITGYPYYMGHIVWNIRRFPIEQKCLTIGQRFILSFFDPGTACPTHSWLIFYS